MIFFNYKFLELSKQNFFYSILFYPFLLHESTNNKESIQLKIVGLIISVRTKLIDELKTYVRKLNIHLKQNFKSFK